MVRRHEPVQKASGQLCKKTRHDYGDKTQDRRHGNGGHGSGVPDDEERTHRADLYRGGMGMPPAVFLPAGEDDPERRENGSWGARKTDVERKNRHDKNKTCQTVVSCEEIYRDRKSVV